MSKKKKLETFIINFNLAETMFMRDVYKNHAKYGYSSRDAMYKNCGLCQSTIERMLINNRNRMKLQGYCKAINMLCDLGFKPSPNDSKQIPDKNEEPEKWNYKDSAQSQAERKALLDIRERRKEFDRVQIGDELMIGLGYKDTEARIDRKSRAQVIDKTNRICVVQIRAFKTCVSINDFVDGSCKAL